MTNIRSSPSEYWNFTSLSWISRSGSGSLTKWMGYLSDTSSTKCVSCSSQLCKTLEKATSLWITKDTLPWCWQYLGGSSCANWLRFSVASKHNLQGLVSEPSSWARHQFSTFQGVPTCISLSWQSYDVQPTTWTRKTSKTSADPCFCITSHSCCLCPPYLFILCRKSLYSIWGRFACCHWRNGMYMYIQNMVFLGYVSSHQYWKTLFWPL